MSTSGLRVLVVDDNQTNRFVARNMLEQLGCSVIEVDSGRGCLDVLADDVCDLVLMDCHMPEMSGYAATQAIRSGRQIANPTVPIVALTAHAIAGAREKCLESGMDDYLAKPFRKAELAGVLDKWGQRPDDPPTA